VRESERARERARSERARARRAERGSEGGRERERGREREKEGVRERARGREKRPFLGRVWASTTSWKKPKIIINAKKYWNLSEL
jgi:hypothetical protein